MQLTLLLLADGATTGAAEGPPGQGLFAMLPFVAMCVFGYLLLIRPMQKQERERQNLVARIKKNDRVVTSGGLIGVVAAIKEKEDELTLRVDDNSNVRVKVTKSSVVRVLSTDDAAKDAKTDG